MITPKVIERLIAIASGEEVPPPTPLSAATEEDQAESAAGEMEESESAAEVDENEAELEPIAQGESEQADPE
ncbi:MAG: hypothetical protein D6790_17470 [Caldilineae bacterium]|nr:MAG: hypothetical protein D6790_17470 [Caldilineae bacterium]